MQDTVFGTLPIQPSGSRTPTVLCKATTGPKRVLVRNHGPSVLFLGLNSEDIRVKPPKPTTYWLEKGDSDVFVLAKNQALYAAAPGSQNRASYSMSDVVESSPAPEAP